MTNRRNILKNFVGMLAAGALSLVAGTVYDKKQEFTEVKFPEGISEPPVPENTDEVFTVSLMGRNKKYNWSSADMFMSVEGVMVNSQGTIHAIVVKK